MTQQEFFTRYTYSPKADKLGGGSFGKVYKAYDTTLDKYVAIKVAEQLETAGKTFSLLDEFKALESLPDHVNIAKYEQLYTFESPQGVFDYAIMQYYADGNLSQLIYGQKLTAEQKENLALQLLNGIGFLHQHKVVHRDMKPSNILIHNRILGGNKEFIPKITDFGLSKKAKTDKGTHFTNSIAAGTYAYSSPEQLKGEELRFNTDLWAYGAIVYELFTGKTLFNIEKTSTGSSALEVREILDNILKSDISTKIAELPPKWQPAITACLERDAQKRVKTAEEILDILHGKTKLVEEEKPNEDTPKASGTLIDSSVPTSSPAPSPLERVRGRKTQILEKQNSEPVKIAETKILEKTENTTSQVPPPSEGVRGRLDLFVGLGVAVFALTMAFVFWPSKKVETQPANPTVAVGDSLAKKDFAVAQTPTETETTNKDDWKTAYNIKLSALQKAEKSNTAETNLSKYKELLATLPSNATEERKAVQSKIDYFTEKLATNTTQTVESTTTKKNLYNLKTLHDYVYDYYGEVKNNLPDGYGTAKFKNGDKYIGYYKYGKMNGAGTYMWSNGDKYVGNYENDKKSSGQGIFYFSNGDKYVGNFESDNFNGYGKLYKNGSLYYSGYYKNSKPTGTFPNYGNE